jgi:radical SAM-linked protein
LSSGDSLRLRVQLTKEGTARYLSHTEFQRNLMLAARRAGLPLAYSEGHRPKMKISLSPPLPIGVTSEGELVDFALDSYLSGAEAAKRLDEVLPPGISVVNARLLGAGSRPVGKLIDTAVYVAFLPGAAGGEGEWKNAVEQFLRSDTVEFERVQPRRTRKVDLRPGVHSLEASADEGGGVAVRMVLDDGTGGTVKPWEVLEVLAGLSPAAGDSWREARVHRMGVYTRRGERLLSPMDAGPRRPAV